MGGNQGNGGIWDSIKESASTTFENVKETIGTAWENVKSTTSEKWGAIKSALSDKWSEVKETASAKFGEVKDTIISKMDELKNKDWSATGKSIVNGIASGLQTIWNTLTGWVRDVKNAIEGAFSGASRGGGFGVSVPSGSFGGRARVAVQAVPDISTFNIPRLAQGAVIPPNREFLAVLGDQRTGTNIEAPLSDIENAVSRAIAASGFAGGNRNITVIMEMNKRELGRVVYQLNNEETQRVGVRLTEVKS